MKNAEGWLFLLIALVWLLPAINVTAISGTVLNWIAIVALALIGIMKVKGK
tara:strand:- start:905 stop:1057 length:153 start_codon:yes stop_codon:yes gene_type:complete